MKSKKVRQYIYDYSKFGMVREYIRSLNKKNAVFIWVPKTAGTSMQIALDAAKLTALNKVKHSFPNKGIVTFGHIDYRQLVDQGYISKEFDDSAYKFAFSRNPYDRFVSLFFWMLKRRILPMDTAFKDFCLQLKNNGCESIGLYNRDGFSQCNPQVRWIENIDINFIGKFETLNADSEILFNRLDINIPAMPHYNQTTHKNYRNYYCAESKAIVEDLYQDDFEYFGYEIEDFLEQKTKTVAKTKCQNNISELHIKTICPNSSAKTSV